MGHEVLYCDYCDRAVMEGRERWECDCGAVCCGGEWKKDTPNEKKLKYVDRNKAQL